MPRDTRQCQVVGKSWIDCDGAIATFVFIVTLE